MDAESTEINDEIEFPGSQTISKVLNTVKRPFRQLLHSSGEPVEWDDSDEYDFSHPNRGNMIIFNNGNFKGHSPRPGTEVDAMNLEKTFTNLGFTIDTHYNQTRNQMIAILRKAAKNDHSQSDCFICAILSHGDEVHVVDSKQPNRHEREDVVYATDSFLLTSEIVNMFNDSNCKTLRGKPRIFFIQACRGNSLDPGVQINVQVDEVDAVCEEIVEVTPCPIYKDCLLMYATPPGFYAFRRPDTGSWFIRALCEIPDKPNIEKRSLHQLLTAVIKHVGLNYQSLSSNLRISGKKQTPCIISKLVKDVYFTPKHDSLPV
ncbi:Caspase-3 [Mactra antiquata]